MWTVCVYMSPTVCSPVTASKSSGRKKAPNGSKKTPGSSKKESKKDLKDSKSGHSQLTLTDMFGGGLVQPNEVTILKCLSYRAKRGRSSSSSCQEGSSKTTKKAKVVEKSESDSQEEPLSPW